MKALIAALALSASAIASNVNAAEPCRWYVNEFDPLSWVEDWQHGDLSVHFPGHGQLMWQFRTTIGTMNDPIKTAIALAPSADVEEPMQFYYRSATVDGRPAMVINMEFYYQSCEQPAFGEATAPAPGPEPKLPKLGVDL